MLAWASPFNGGLVDIRWAFIKTKYNRRETLALIYKNR